MQDKVIDMVALASSRLGRQTWPAFSLAAATEKLCPIIICTGKYDAKQGILVGHSLHFFLHLQNHLKTNPNELLIGYHDRFCHH